MSRYPRLTLEVEFRKTPAPVEASIWPPEWLLEAPPSPVTVRPPLEPVLLRMMPLAAPFDEMLWNVRLLAPMVVWTTLSAVPLPELMLLPEP